MDDFAFDKELNSFFSSVSGVGSRVTLKDEATKRQLTLVEHEKKLLLKYHPVLPIGSLKAAHARGENINFKFRKYPTGQIIHLRINYPKPNRPELRMYFHKDAFSPNADDFWFIFERNNELWIGSLASVELQAARKGAWLDLQNGFDHNVESAYQYAINNNIPKLISTSNLRYKRDPKIARNALNASGYTCEMMPHYKTFKSKTTQKPYLEAHHFVPMMEQRNFSSNLDTEENICILNPYAHKMLHHATYSEIAPFLKKLAKPRASFLQSVGISIDNILHYYGGP